MKPLVPVRLPLEIEGFHTVYYFEFGKNFSHPPEKHDFWEMVYVDKGKIIAVTDGVGCTLEQGQAVFHEPNEIHAHISDNRVANNMLVITFSCHSSVMEFFKRKTFTLDKTSKTLLSLFMQEAENAIGGIPGVYKGSSSLDFSEEKFGASQLMQFHFTEFLIKLFRSGTELYDNISVNAEARTIAKNSIAELVARYLEENVCASLGLEDICRHFYIGKSRLSVIFGECMGQSPMQYYSELKVTEAKKLLREDNLSVSRIADLLGYSGIHNFSRAFKRSTGFSPTEYKKSIL